MASRRRTSNSSSGSSIKCGWIPLELEAATPSTPASFDAPTEAGDRKSRQKSGSQGRSDASGGLLSTAELVSAVGGLWKAVEHPLASSRSDESRGGNRRSLVSCADQGVDVEESSSSGSHSFRFDFKSVSQSETTVKSESERLRKFKKGLLFDPSNRFVDNTFFSVHGRTTLYGVCSAACGHCRVDNVRGLCRFANEYGHVNEFFPLGLRGLILMKVGRNENKERAESFPIEGNTCSKDLFDVGKEVKGCSSSAECKASPCHPSTNFVDIGECHPSCLSYTNEVIPTMDIAKLIIILRRRHYGLYASSLVEGLASQDCKFGQCQLSVNPLNLNVAVESSEGSSVKEDSILEEKGKILSVGPSTEEKYAPNLSLSVQEKLSTAFVNKKHALAGAMAGTFVSLCLHPVDTVKTIMQARSMNQTSICQTFKSVISERGMMGLYRGIATNIATSAPISAVYTFTYETVKAAMVPHLLKDYHSLAHCTAGGCASIATSFIFTPSDRIKQQMQVRYRYQNCWTALLAIFREGGLSSFYAGWGAVLCRNIPHSVIKFYTYERLKKLILQSSQSDSPLNTMQTLVCGGIAGSTAALFTTPFDVVKTRIQTQVPGSLTLCSGVFITLEQIARQEGIRGLYRGLIPRLAMYISQGAIFFASYEYFKTLLSLEACHVQTSY